MVDWSKGTYSESSIKKIDNNLMNERELHTAGSNANVYPVKLLANYYDFHFICIVQSTQEAQGPTIEINFARAQSTRSPQVQSLLVSV